jgi:aflatoxin B1 aldehyde reductase
VGEAFLCREVVLIERFTATNYILEGKFKEFALSNFAAWEVVKVYHICKSKGWVLPTIYQGMYNPITR